MAKYFLGYFSNGFCGYEETHGFIAEDIESVRLFCEGMLPEYAEDVIMSCLNEEEMQDNDTVEEYFSDCYCEVEEVSKEKMEEEMNDEDPFIV